MSQPFPVARDGAHLVVFMPTLSRENAAQWRTLLGMLIPAGFHDFVLDLSGMAYVDSLGLAEIVRSFTFCSRSSATLNLNRPSKAMRELLEVTRLSTIFTILDADYSNLARVEVSVDGLGPLVKTTT